jgi:putative transcriptional regulator
MTNKFVFLTNIIVITTNIVYNSIEVKDMKSRVKELRARHGWNQTELAHRANISRQTVSLIEREEFMPSLLIAAKIARVFETTIEDIFQFNEEELL